MIQPEGDGKIESGRKVLIYREKTIVHPVTGQMLDTIKDDIVEAPVLWVGDRTIVVTADEPYFDMIMVDDRAAAIRGSVKPMTGSVHEVGRVAAVNAEAKNVEIAGIKEGMIIPGDALAVVRYLKTVSNPDTGEILAVAVEPVAVLKITTVDGKQRASYSLIDEKLGWIEIDDVIIKRTGDMITENMWFEDPPAGFSGAWIFGRNYLRAIRHHDSGRYREAILELNDVIQSDPEYREAFHLIGLCYANLNRYEEAVASFEQFLALRPDDAKTWTALAYAYLKQGNPEGSAKSYENLTRLLPNNSRVWTDLGDIYRMLGEPQKAKQAYRKALEIDENDEEAKYELQVKEEQEENSSE